MTKTHNIEKEYLADPVAYLTTLNTALSADEIDCLEKLDVQYRHTKKTIKRNKTEKGVLSRSIGQLKKEGKDITNTLQEVKAVSLQLEDAAAEFKRLELAIMAFFPKPTQASAAEESRVLVLPEQRRQQQSGQNTVVSEVYELTSENEQWDEFVRNLDGASIYHLSAWRELISSCFGHQTIYLYAINSLNQFIGVLPLVRLKSRLFGDFLVSVPYFNYGGALAVNAEVESVLMNKAAGIANDLGVDHVEFRDDISRPDWPARTDKVAMVLPLPPTEIQFFDSLASKLRSQVNKARKQNLLVRFGGIDLLEDFYRVYSKNMRDLGTPVYSQSFFAKILTDFEQESTLIVLQHDGRPVSAGFLLASNETLEIPWASTLREANKLNANMLMYAEILCFAIKNQYRYFDFGRSSKDSGTYQFKKQWGALEKQMHWHYFLKPGEPLPMLNPNNPKFSLLIQIWRKLPVFVTNLIGPAIVKNLP